MDKSFNKGEKVYIKGKYGMFYKVIIKRIDGNYAFIEGNRFIIGKKKVRLDNLCTEPSKTFKQESEKLKIEIEKAKNELYKLKNKGHINI